MFKKLDPLKPYVYKYRVQFFWGGLVLLLNNLIWIFFPQVIGRAINDLNKGITQHKIVTYSLELIAIALGKGVFQFLMRWILIGISREIEFDLRNDLFRHLESLSYSYYQRTRVGDIMARATNDLAARKAIYEKMTAKFMANGWIIYLYHPQYLIAQTVRVENFRPMPDGLLRVVGVRLK